MVQRRSPIDLDDARTRVRTHELLPWSSEQVVALVAANIVAFAMAAVGWWQTLARGESPSDQLGWLNLAILGLLVSGCANVLWLAVGRRTVTLAKTAVVPHSWIRAVGVSDHASTGGVWAAVPGVPVRAQEANGTRKAQNAASGDPVASTPMTRYHRPDCILAKDKDVFAADVARHVDAGRRPCEICRP